MLPENRRMCAQLVLGIECRRERAVPAELQRAPIERSCASTVHVARDASMEPVN